MSSETESTFNTITVIDHSLFGLYFCWSAGDPAH